MDDFVNKEILKIFIYESEKNNCDIVFCNSSQNLEEIDTLDYLVNIYTKNEALEKFLLRKIKIGIWGLFIKRDLLIQNDLYFKEGYAYSEDLHMVFRIFNCSDRIIHIELPLYNYRENEGSVMTRVDEKRFDSIFLMKDLEQYFKKNNPEFYPMFLKFGVSRTSWAILWQAVRYLDYSNFKIFINKYDFKSDMKKLLRYPDIKVNLSSLCFLFSYKIYYYIIKVITKNHRR